MKSPIIPAKVYKAIRTWYGCERILVFHYKNDPLGRLMLVLYFHDEREDRRWGINVTYARAKYQACHKITLPASLEVDHKDGNRLNDRLSNYRLLSKSDNVKEAYRAKKARGETILRHRGHMNVNSNLRERDVVRLREYRAKTKKSLEACISHLELDLSVTNAMKIVQGKTYVDVAGPIEGGKTVRAELRSGKLTEKDVIRLRKLYAKGGRTIKECLTKLALKIGEPSAWSLLHGKTWKHVGGPLAGRVYKQQSA